MSSAVRRKQEATDGRKCFVSQDSQVLGSDNSHLVDTEALWHRSGCVSGVGRNMKTKQETSNSLFEIKLERNK